MQLTAHYLSHSLLASILICEREKEVNEREQGGMKRRKHTKEERDSTVSDRTKVREEIETNIEKKTAREERKR